MSFVCLRTPHWPTGEARPARPRDSDRELPAALLAITPHVVVHSGGMIWLDARGLDLPSLAHRAWTIAQTHDTETRIGAASTVIAAALAALHGATPLTIVPSGQDRSFLAPIPLAKLVPSTRLASVFTSVGCVTCGDLARLTQEAVEVRFGAEGVALWRLARADDRRQLFTFADHPLPSASLAWEEYALRYTEPLLFLANRLLTTVCAELHAVGQGARTMTLTLTLVNRTTLTSPLRVARETASRPVWTRQLRLALERMQLSDGVVGCAIQVDAVGVPAAQQGDMFDRGFQTAQAVEEALLRLEEDGDAHIVEPITSFHSLPEYRVQWATRSIEDIAHVLHPVLTTTTARAPHMVLHTFTTPAPIEVVSDPDRGSRIPREFRSSHQSATPLLTVAGPDYVSGHTEQGARYARAYFTGLTNDGAVVLLFFDVLAEAWYWQGWWA